MAKDKKAPAEIPWRDCLCGDNCGGQEVRIGGKYFWVFVHRIPDTDDRDLLPVAYDLRDEHKHLGGEFIGRFSTHQALDAKVRQILRETIKEIEKYV